MHGARVSSLSGKTRIAVSLAMLLLVLSSLGSMHSALRASEEAKLGLKNLVQPSDGPNYPEWEWKWGKIDPFMSGETKIEEELFLLKSVSREIYEACWRKVFSKGYHATYYIGLRWPSWEEPRILWGKLKYDRLTEELAKKWEKNYGEYPLPREAFLIQGVAGQIAVEVYYMPYSEGVKEARSDMEEACNMTRIKEKGITITDDMIIEDIRREGEFKADHYLLYAYEDSLKRLTEDGAKVIRLVDTDNMKIAVGVFSEHCPPLSLTRNPETDEPLYKSIDSINTTVCYNNYVYHVYYVAWMKGEAKGGYVTALIRIFVGEFSVFGLPKDENEYETKSGFWDLSDLAASHEIPVKLLKRGVRMEENPGFTMTFIPDEDPMEGMLEPRELIREVEASLQRILSRIGMPRKVHVTSIELPSIEFTTTAVQGEDYIKISAATPSPSEELKPLECYDLRIKAKVGLYSSDKASVKASIYVPTPKGNMSLLEASEAAPVLVEGRGESEGELEYRVCIPKELASSGGEMVVELALLPEGSDKPTATARLKYRIASAAAKLSYELSKESVIANGRDTVEIVVKATDEEGRPVKGRVVSLKLSRPQGLDWLRLEPCVKRWSRWDYEAEGVTGEDGTVTFTYRAPRIIQARYPAVSEKSDPFPVYDELVLIDKMTGQETRIRVRLESPYPRIEKAAISQPVWTDTWSKITIVARDPDDDRATLYLRSSLPGSFDYKGSIAEAWSISLEVPVNEEIHVGFRPEHIGLNISDVPEISDMLWNKTKNALWNLIPLMISEREKVGKAYMRIEKYLNSKGVPVITSDKLARYLAWGDEKTIKAIDRLAYEAGLSKEARDNLIKFINEKAADDALTLNDWFGTEQTLGGAAWRASEKLENLSKGDVDLLGLYLDGFYLIIGVGGLFEDGTAVAKVIKLRPWKAYLINTVLDYLYGFKELYDKYDEIGNAVERTFPAAMIVRVTDPEGHTAQRLIKFYVLYYSKGGSGPSPSPETGRAAEVAEAIERYYKACQEEDMDAYLDALYTDGMSKEELGTLLNATRAMWSAVDTVSYRIEGLQVGFSEDGGKAAASYRISGTLKAGNETIDLGYDVVAVLVRSGGKWRIQNIFVKQQFYELLAYTTLSTAVLEERRAALEEAMRSMPSLEAVEIKGVSVEAGRIRAVVEASIQDESSHVLAGVFTSPGGRSYIVARNVSKGSGRTVLELNATGRLEKGEWSLDVYVDGIHAASTGFGISVEEQATSPETQAGSQAQEGREEGGGGGLALAAAVLLIPVLIAVAAVVIIERRSRRA